MTTEADNTRKYLCVNPLKRKGEQFQPFVGLDLSGDVEKAFGSRHCRPVVVV